MIFNTSIWILLVACGAAFQVYDEVQPMDMEVVYDEYSGLDPYGLELGMDATKSLMMFKIYNAIHKIENVPEISQYRSRFSMVDNPLVSNLQIPALLDIGDGLMKRNGVPVGISSAPTAENKNKPVIRKQPKWKSKNGRKGAYRLCYLKLCSFLPLAPALRSK